MIATIPPRGHFSEATVEVDAEGVLTIGVGTSEFGNGTTTVHTQLVASAFGASADQLRIRQSDTAAARYDTGAFGSAGTVVAGKAVYAAAVRLLADLRSLAKRLTGLDGSEFEPDDEGLLAPDGTRVTFGDLALAAGGPVSATGTEGRRPALARVQRAGLPRRRPRVDRRGPHPAVGAGRGCGLRHQPGAVPGAGRGGVAQAIGSALYEEVILDGAGTVTTAILRNYHIPQMADVPTTEVLFADTADDLGPFGAKSMSEAPYNPVAPALANAVRDAIGVRPHELPLSRDRVWRLLHPGAAPVRSVSAEAPPG
ncbi:xanthine dehydrogenase family protein molybdopterin-binding subunit [Rathayibacter oskolensis]|uniref:xanthine dehydrogenase family protein molybdopterin-binding subunit n=1 Tax=Rathayibacter oskolensis TaxID=1891671 RepID=UPI003F5D4E1B